MAKKPVLTTSAGNPIADNQNSITAGPLSPEGNWDLVGNNSQNS